MVNKLDHHTYAAAPATDILPVLLGGLYFGQSVLCGQQTGTLRPLNLTGNVLCSILPLLVIGSGNELHSLLLLLKLLPLLLEPCFFQLLEYKSK